MSGHEGVTHSYRGDIEPLGVELVMQEAGSTGDGEVVARFAVPVLLCHDDTTDRGWRVDFEAMEDDLMQQVRRWALNTTHPLTSIRPRGKRAV